MIPIVISTSPRTEWALPGMLTLLNKYMDDRHSFLLHIFGFDETAIQPRLPTGQSMLVTSIGKFADFPANKWSDGFIAVLNRMLERDIDVFWFMLDDYWPIRGIDAQGIKDLYAFHQDNADHILKIDLTYDRLRAGGVTDYEQHPYVGHMDMIQADPVSQYHMSLWGGLFSTKLLLDVVKPGWTAQEVELNGTPVLRDKGYKVLGTRQAPLLHQNVCHAGGIFNFPGPQVSDVDMNYLRECGLTNGC